MNPSGDGCEPTRNGCQRRSKTQGVGEPAGENRVLLVKVAASALGCQQVYSSVWAKMARPAGLAPVTSGQALLHESPVGQALLPHLTERGTGAERVLVSCLQSQSQAVTAGTPIQTTGHKGRHSPAGPPRGPGPIAPVTLTLLHELPEDTINKSE